VDQGEQRPSVLVVDDDETFRARLAKALRARGYDVREAADGSAALDSARADSPELAIIDLRMPGISGLALLGELRAIDPETRVLMLTGYGSIATAVEAMRAGAIGYVTKPADVDQILNEFSRFEAQAGNGAGLPAPSAPPTTPSLARTEWEHIQRVLTDCAGNVSQAARALHIHRRSLQRKLGKAPPR
jgi:two-component system response regulator RegA